ncbi:FliK [Desulforapulum autotrophicum HRM2]|uniref:FliK n=1 Tax=Desulforapulum autotrophicum (strain ATCC 43914 / DSM 3382 / VKM B-1955 / HRM2) TaxID=177437 RepID=C0QA45_DESAH|nr:flagellar hook-length control protein FliK [Desulforapulum autotrophicum]ACN16763.1 FliK [Desulforapulum autotrophicum HRM2]
MNSGVQIFSPELFRQLKGGEKAVLPALGDGRIVDATVLKVLSPTRAELMVAGKRLVAETSILLTPGQTLELKVTGEGGFEIVKPMTETVRAPLLIPGRLSAAFGSLTDKSPFSHLAALVSSETGASVLDSELAPLKDLLMSTALKSETPDPGFILRVLEKIAILREKGQAMLSLSDPGNEEILKPVGKFIDAMEKFQMLNSQSSDMARYLIPFSIFSSEAFTFGQLFFDLGEKKDKARSENHRLVKASLFLDMTNLGALRVDLSVLNKEITASFQVADEDVVSFVRTMVPTLRQRLTTQGFKVLQVTCTRGTPEMISQASIAEQFVNQETSNLDLMV